MSSLAPVLLSMPDKKTENENSTVIITDNKIPDTDPRSQFLQNNQQLDQNINYNENKNMKYGNYYENFGESFARRNDIPLGASEDRIAILGELSNRLIEFENRIEKGFENSLFSFNNVNRKHNLWNENDNHNSISNNNNNKNDNSKNGYNNDNDDDDNDKNNNKDNNDNNNNDNAKFEEDKNKSQLNENLENRIVTVKNSDDENEIIKNEIYNIKKQISNKSVNKGKRIWNQRIVPPEFYGNFDRFDKIEPIRYLGRASSFSDYTGFQSEKSNQQPR